MFVTAVADVVDKAGDSLLGVLSLFSLAMPDVKDENDDDDDDDDDDDESNAVAATADMRLSITVRARRKVFIALLSRL